MSSELREELRRRGSEEARDEGGKLERVKQIEQRTQGPSEKAIEVGAGNGNLLRPTLKPLDLKIDADLEAIQIPRLRESRQRGISWSFRPAEIELQAEAEVIRIGSGKCEVEQAPRPRIESEGAKLEALEDIGIPKESGLERSLRPAIKEPEVKVEPSEQVRIELRGEEAPPRHSTELAEVRQTAEPLTAELKSEAATPEAGPEGRNSSLLDKGLPLLPVIRELSEISCVADRPVCIVLPKGEDSFVGAVAIICREIYRIVKGGMPKARWISKGLKEEIEDHLRAEGMVFVVDDPKCELFPDLEKTKTGDELFKKVDMEKVLDRMRELFSQDFGFIIFHVNREWAGRLADLLREEAKSAKVIEIQPPALGPGEKATLASICWDFVEADGFGTFDSIFEKCEKDFFDELENELKGSPNLELLQYIERDESAGWEHENMKVAVVKLLAKELGAKSMEDVVKILKGGEIKTEHELEGRRRADIYVPSQNRYVEIETFYGTGNPMDKLKRTLQKYSGIKGRVDVVLLTGIHALLYAPHLLELEKQYKPGHDLRVNFYIPDLKDGRLVSLREVLDLLKGMSSSGSLGLTREEEGRFWEVF